METEQNKKNANVLLQGSILAAASLIVRIIGMVYRIPLTRIVGDTAMGYYTTAFEFYNIALLLSSYSLPLAVSKLVSARQITGRHVDSARVLKVGLVFGVIVGGAASLIVYFGADLYGRFNDTPAVAIPLRVLAPTIFVFAVMGVVRGFFQGYGNMVPTALSQIIEQIVNAVVSVVAAMIMMKKYQFCEDQSAYGAAGGTWGTFLGACAGALTLIVIFLIQRRYFLKQVAADRDREAERYGQILKILLITVIPVVISQTVYQISGLVDVSVFNRVLSAKQYDEELRTTWLGIYSNKYRLLTNVPVAIASAMGTAIVPSLVAEIASGRKHKVNEKIASAIKFNMVIAFPCAFGLMALGGPILYMLYGDTHELSAQMLNIGGIAVVFFALSTVTNGVLQGINHMFLPVRHSLIALIVHCGVLIALLKYTELDAIAMVICNILFAVIVCILNARSIRKLSGYKQEWRTTFVIPLISAAVMGAFSDISYRSLNKALLGGIPTRPGICNMIACLVTIGACVLVYFATLLLLGGVTAKEVREMPKGRTIANVFIKLHLLKDDSEESKK